MGWIIWAVLGIILIGVLVGAYRGALRIMVSVVAFALTIGITFFATPFVADIVMEKTPIDDSIREYVVSSMSEIADTLLSEDEESKEVSEEDEKEAEVEELQEKTEIPRDIQIQAIESAELPEVFKNLLKENNNSEIYQELGVETFAQYAGTYLAKIMIHVASFLVLFLIVTIILRAIVFALNIVNDIPVFGLTNRLAGAALGIICSLMVVWFFFIVVTLFYSTDIGKQMYDTIQANDYMKIIYENNPLFDISIKF